ncbi:Acyl-CoA N-acyltransferases (NAT) superfamily protein [Rhynchospora pubera]|uniref:Acyl-CoA N-acyltransferases (NAT) superfamily protein n=1 Tax=Rhynchospora pubera TaxID=906938 RepID=A0AAV8GNS4_9POAL|nr:Acyl-CoA N-acyltransferases (NAT) superfamily protein [Rhynchospora pubera]
MEEDDNLMIVIREFDPLLDRDSVESVERMCEVGPSGKISLFTDLLGDPLCRIRHSPSYLMLVAETGGPLRETVGLIRGCVKTVTCGRKLSHRNNTASIPIATKAAYLLGLRVSPAYRRRGIALKLVHHMEQWFKQMGAEYSYMATDEENEASVKLFTERCGYNKFRAPSVLVNPVYRHHIPVPRRRVKLVRLSPREAQIMYRHQFACTEFFPHDINSVLNNPLSLGTFLAVPVHSHGSSWDGIEKFLASPPDSWAVLSVWNCKNSFQLEVRGVSRLVRALAGTSRFIDRMLPWFKIPSFPNLFRPFGVYFLYGVGGAGPKAQHLMRALCAHAHNMAREGGCGLVATEVAACEPIRDGVPHWRRLSFADLWCVKRLSEEYSDGEIGDWTKARPPPSIFVDPREV